MYVDYFGCQAILFNKSAALACRQCCSRLFDRSNNDFPGEQHPSFILDLILMGVLAIESQTTRAQIHE